MKPRILSAARLSLAFASAIAALLAISYAHAATLYWDGNDTTANADGGAGTWNTSNTNWDTLLNGGANTTWSGTTDTAYFGSTASTAVALGSNVSVGGLYFNTTAYTITTTGFAMNFAATNNSIVFDNVAAATITGPVGGSGDVILSRVGSQTASTLTLDGAGTGGWSGSTTINPGVTLALGSTTGTNSANQSLLNTSGITINGGVLSLNFGTSASTNRVKDDAAITVNGGATININTSNAAISETMGGVTLNSGLFGMSYNNNPSSGGTMTFSGGLNRVGLTSTMAVASSTNGVWRFTGAANTGASEIIGPWATTGGQGGLATQTDYAIYTGANGTIASRGTAASAASGWSTTWASTSNYTLANAAGSAANGKLAGSLSVNTVRNTTTPTGVTADNTTDLITLTGHGFVAGDVVVFGGTTAPAGLTNAVPYYVVNPSANTFQVAATSGGSAINFTANGSAVNITGGITLGANTLGTFGILNGSAAALAIGSNGGSITLPTNAAGNLFVTAGNAQIQIDAPIVDPGVGNALTLVKSGSGALTLRGNNTYTGATVVNAGALTITGDNSAQAGDWIISGGGSISFGTPASMGAAGRNLTFNGSGGTFNGYNNSGAPNSSPAMGVLTVNEGAYGIYGVSTGNNITFASATGSGTFAVGPGAGNSTLTITDASAFTGTLGVTSGSSSTPTLSLGKLADGNGYGNLVFVPTGTAGAATFKLTGNTSALTFATGGRSIEIARGGPTTPTLDNAMSQTWTINTDLINNSVSATTLTFASSAGTGNTVFAGLIGNGAGNTVLNLTKSGSNSLTLSGANTYTGTTTIGATTSGGTLVINTLKNYGEASSLGAPTSGDIIFNKNAVNYLVYVGGENTTNRTIRHEADVSNRNNGSGIYNNGTGALIFNGSTFNTPFVASGNGGRTTVLNLGGTYAGSANEIGGVIANNDSVSLIAITKADAGIWTLSGTNTYSGATTVQAGTLIAGANAPSGSAGAFGNATSDINLGVASGSTDASILTGGAFTIGRIIRNATSNTTDSGTRVLTLGGSTADNSEFSGNIFLGTTNQTSKGIQLTAAAGGQVTFSGVIQNPTGQTGGEITSAAALNAVTKVGAGTVILSNANTYTGKTVVSAGTLKLGANNVIPDASSVSIGSATLDADTRTDTAGTLDVTGSAVINLGSGAALVFANSSAGGTATWAGTLTLVGFVSGSSLNFGSPTGLTAQQLGKISATGFSNFSLDAEGDLIADNGGGPGPVDHFDISAISSPQTVGTPITGITLTAKDASNATATGFTGTVTFGGTGGFTGTSASFTAGVLSGVSVTPTLAGSNLTFTVNDGSGHTGSTTITTIQSIYDSWASSYGLTGGDALSTANPDGDTLTNLQEFAFGTNPTVSSTGPITWSGASVTAHGTPVVIEESGMYYAVYGRRVDHATAGLTYTQQFSADLTSTWYTETTPGTVIASDGVIDAVKIALPGLIPTDSGPQKARFFKCGVSQ